MEWPDEGRSLRNRGAREILKHFHNDGDVPAVFFWRSSDGVEVEFVIETAGRLHAIEAKASAIPVPAMAEQLLAWRRVVGAAASRTVIACDAGEPRPLTPDVEAIPWRSIDTFLRGILSGEGER